jgi:hypothetical protein
LGKRIYNASFEIQGLITSQNYKSSLTELNLLSKGNPFYTIYPITKEVEPLLPKSKLDNCSCSDSYMNFEYLSVNIYEVTWIKYHPKHPISNYVKKYLPVYTQMHYENKKLLKSKINSHN